MLLFVGTANCYTKLVTHRYLFDVDALTNRIYLTIDRIHASWQMPLLYLEGDTLHG